MAHVITFYYLYLLNLHYFTKVVYFNNIRYDNNAGFRFNLEFHAVGHKNQRTPLDPIFFI